MRTVTIIFFASFLMFVNNIWAQDASDNEGNVISGKNPEDIAADAAAREMGRIIARGLGQEALTRLTREDRLAMLDRARAATRGEMIRHYNFEESPYYNALSGYVSVICEGKNVQGNRCLQYEIDLVHRVNRYFFQPVMCQSNNGEWKESSIEDITSVSRGAPSPIPGDWLPPIH